MKSFFAPLFILFFISNLSAQNIIGNVRDMNSQPIIDAYIYISSSKIHAHSDELGNFKLNGAVIGDTLVTTYLGYKTEKTLLTEESFQNSIEIIMQDGKVLLDQVMVNGAMRSTNQISSIDLQLNPVQSSQEILQKVPGLIIAQHAGGGKAEQIFLRGFDIDHGTDIAISVDGMPV